MIWYSQGYGNDKNIFSQMREKSKSGRNIMNIQILCYTNIYHWIFTNLIEHQ